MRNEKIASPRQRVDIGNRGGRGVQAESETSFMSSTKFSMDRSDREPETTGEEEWVDLDEEDKLDFGAGPASSKVLIGKRGRLVTFFRNGDSHFKGLTTSVNHRHFSSFESLLVWLNEKVATTAGVRYIFGLPDGKEVTEIGEFHGGRCYVCSSVRKLVLVPYGANREHFWKNRMPSAGKLRKGERSLYGGKRLRGTILGAPQSAARPRVLTIISNTNRESTEKVMLNPATNQTYEEILSDIANMVLLGNPPIHALYTADAPQRKVKSFSHLLRELKDCERFLVCGSERRPLEMLRRIAVHESSQRNPVRHSSQSSSKPVAAPRHSDSSFASIGQRDYQSTTPSSVSLPTGLSSEASTPRPPLAESISSRRSESPPRRRNVHTPSQRTRSTRDKHSSSRQSYKKQEIEAEAVRVEIHGRQRKFYAPRCQLTDPDGRRPDRRIRLDWVYGYRGHDARDNLFVLGSGELLYFVASVAVILDKKKQKQRHYTEHTEDITCLSLHPEKPYAASGQMSGRDESNSAHIRIWDTRTLSTYKVIGLGVFEDGISAVSFFCQRNRDLLMAIDESDRHVLSVWNWKEEDMLAKTTTLQNFNNSLAGTWTSLDTAVWGLFHATDPSVLVTFGKQHLFFWRFFQDSQHQQSGRILRDKNSGLFQEGQVPKYVTAVSFLASGDVVSGDSNGRIIVWTRDSSDAFVQSKRLEHLQHAHTRSIFVLHMSADGILISAGGSEIKAWDTVNSFKLVHERTIPESCGSIRSLLPQHRKSLDGAIYVGTNMDNVLEGTLQERFCVLVQGHSDELWAIATHPEDHSFVTAGYDQQVTRWSTVKHRVQWRVSVEKPCLSICFEPNGRLVAVGTTVGRFVVLNAESGQHVTSVQVGDEPIDCLQYSPAGMFIAMGSHDTHCHVFAVHDNGHVYRKYKSGTLKGHRNIVTQLDWSSEGKSLQSVSGDYEQLFWSLEKMAAEEPAKMADTEWDTQSCMLGYNLLGAWSNLREDEEVQAVARSTLREILAVGDSEGNIKLYKYPACTHQPQYHQRKAFSGNVTKLAFSFDDGYLLAIGGMDCGIIQWAVIDAHEFT